MMIDDLYQASLSTLQHHLDQAGADYHTDDGEIVLGPHRLGLAIAFEGCVPQGDQMLAPVEFQIHVDGDSGDRFRTGTLGVGADPAKAIQDAIHEWHTLAAWPLLTALGADVERPARCRNNWPAGTCFPVGSAFAGRCPRACRPAARFTAHSWSD